MHRFGGRGNFYIFISSPTCRESHASFFIPPQDDDEEEDEDEQPTRNVDEALQQAQAAARAKQLRAKFERWETKEIQREQNNAIQLFDGDDQSQTESAKS